MLRGSELGDAKVDELDVRAGGVGEESVVRLDVAVDDLVVVEVGGAWEAWGQPDPTFEEEQGNEPSTSWRKILRASSSG